nr:glycosyl hydrolase [Pandoraea terrae]
MTPSWETVTTTYGKSDKPYGGGAFRIRDNDVISLKIAGAEIHYRVVGLDKGYNGAQAVPEEAWANDVHERLNRTTVSLLRGTLDGGLTRVFEQRGQTGAWWYSEDWRTLYVSTGWLDYKAPVRKDVLKPQITKLWRSQDGGKTWAQLNWPELQDIDRLLFVDPMRGYAIGWGPHVWRTTDGGQSWQEIKVPPQARNAQQPRKKFEAVDLGPDGTLRVAYYVGQLGEHDASSVVYRLARDQQDFELDVVLPQQVVVGLQSSQETTGRYSIYALSRLGAPRNRADREDKGHRPGVLSSWVSYPQPRVEQLHTFDDRLSVDGLDVGKRGVLLVYATDRRRAGASHDYTLSSTDFGKSWRETNDKVIQGGYFDSETNTQYGLYAYTLKKRSF